MTIQGTAPTTEPMMNGVHHVDFRSGGLAISMSQPKRIMATFTPAMAMRAAMSCTPGKSAMTMIIRVEDKEYSSQRKRLIPFASSRRYLFHPIGEAIKKWKNADRYRKDTVTTARGMPNAEASRSGGAGIAENWRTESIASAGLNIPCPPP